MSNPTLNLVGEQARNGQASKNDHSVKEAQVKPRSIRLREPVLNCSDVRKKSQSWTNNATIAPAGSHCPHVAELTGRLWFGVIRSYSPGSVLLLSAVSSATTDSPFHFTFRVKPSRVVLVLMW